MSTKLGAQAAQDIIAWRREPARSGRLPASPWPHGSRRTTLRPACADRAHRAWLLPELAARILAPLEDAGKRHEPARVASSGWSLRGCRGDDCTKASRPSIPSPANGCAPSAPGAARDEAWRASTPAPPRSPFEVGRRRATLPHLRNELDDIAQRGGRRRARGVLARLDDFRGASRFTTWAYKFALLEAAVKLRRRAWQGREVPLEPETWGLFSSAGIEPDEEAEQSELLATLQRAIAEVLTPHQRRVLVALALNGVPIDVLAERLNTTRGALYKTLHDARRKLRGHLEERGLPSTRLEEN